MVQSRRPATRRIYNHTWRSFRQWATRRDLDPRQPSHKDVLQFLYDGWKQGLRPNTLKRQVAAIRACLGTQRAKDLGANGHIRRFLKGAQQLAPPVRHRFPTWRLATVLQALTKPPFEPLKKVELNYLSWKVAFLVAVTSARRVSELGALSTRRELCTFQKEVVVLRTDPSFITKANTAFHLNQPLVLPSFCPRPQHPKEKLWHKLDVRRALRVYLDRTAGFRLSDALFVSHGTQNLGRKVTKSTIAYWVKQCIFKAYEAQGLAPPRAVTAHSTRSAATTTAFSTRASVEEICRAATWSSFSTFVRHYRMDQAASAEAAFGRRVLQQVVEASE